MQVAPISTTKEAGGEGGVAHKFFYPTTDADVAVVQYGTTAGASAALTKLVAAAAKKAIKARGAFTIALTGARFQDTLCTRSESTGKPSFQLFGGFKCLHSGRGKPS